MGTMLKLRRNQVLVREEERFVVVGRATDCAVNLRRESDDSLSCVPEATLIAEFERSALTFSRRRDEASESVKRLTSGDYGDVPAKGRAEAERRNRYLRAIGSLTHFRMSNSKLTQLIAEVAKAHDDEDPPCGKTVRRWVARAIANGFEEVRDLRVLVPRNHACGGDQDKFGPVVRSIVDDVIDELVMAPEKTTVSDCHLLLTKLIDEKQKTLKKGAPKLVTPSKRTFYRIVQAISAEARTEALEGKLKARNKHGLVGLGPQGDYVLHEVEIDHTRLDIIVVCPETGLPIGRPTITLALDRWSRMIVGVYVSLEAAGWRPAMMCLRISILPKATLLAQDPEDLRTSGEWPAMGLFDRLILDNGAEFHSEDLMNAAGQLGFELQYCPAGQPRYKGKCERLFRRLNAELIHTLPGTTFSNPRMRGKYDSKKNACLTLAQLRAAIHRWVVEIYVKTPHTKTKETPLERWRRGVNARGGLDFPDSVDEVIRSLAEVEHRTLTKKGVELHGLHYSCRLDADLRAMLNDPARPSKVKVRVDRGNIGYVMVEDFRSRGRYITVPCTDLDYAQGMSVDEHLMVAARVREAVKGKRALTMNELRDAKAKLRADVEEIRRAGRLAGARLNHVFPAAGKVTDIGEDGLPVKAPLALTREAAQPVVQIPRPMSPRRPLKVIQR